MAIASPDMGLFAEQAPNTEERTRLQRVMDWFGKAPVRATIRPTYVVAEGEWAPSEAKLTPAQVTTVIDEVLAMEETVYERAMTSLEKASEADSAASAQQSPAEP